MSAQLKHIAKYTQGYQVLFPDSAILLVQSSIKDTFASGLCPAKIYHLNAGIAAGKNRRLVSSCYGEPHEAMIRLPACSVLKSIVYQYASSASLLTYDRCEAG